jgi:hypothetical protein
MSNGYKIMRLRYTDDSIYLDLYNDTTTDNFELTYRHSRAIKYYRDIKKILSMYQHNNIRINIYAIIYILETRRKEILRGDY